MRTANHNIPGLRRPTRSAIATLLTLCYLMISLTPLMPLAMYSKTSAPAVNLECSGDCATCGCPEASRVSRTCCCTRKQQQQSAQAHEAEHDETADCSQKKPGDRETVIAACGCPWESGEKAVLSTGETDEQMPFHFSKEIRIPHSDTNFSIQAHQLTSRHGDPPDPPPKLLHCS